MNRRTANLIFFLLVAFTVTALLSLSTVAQGREPPEDIYPGPVYTDTLAAYPGPFYTATPRERRYTIPTKYWYIWTPTLPPPP